jgi:hypothetical protein
MLQRKFEPGSNGPSAAKAALILQLCVTAEAVTYRSCHTPFYGGFGLMAECEIPNRSEAF